jgi:hypothetical protein
MLLPRAAFSNESSEYFKPGLHLLGEHSEYEGVHDRRVGFPLFGASPDGY